MTTLSTSLASSHIHQHLHFTPPLEAKDIFSYKPAEVVDIALSDLQNSGIELIEWRALLLSRMNVPRCVNSFSYLVRDDDLEGASCILSKIGLPITPPTKIYLVTEGDFRAKGRYHRITRTTLESSVLHLTLYPLSFSTLSLLEMEENPPSHITPSRCHSILVPSPPAVYASILRMMLQYPRFCGTMYTLQTELSELIAYHLLGMEGYVDPFDDEKWASLEIDRRLADAVDRVRTWGVDGLWREDEEWMTDALAAVVGTGKIEDLPCKT